jgi:single-strand DNA-binding protein
MNFIIVLGHLGADAETRFTPSGQKVTNLRLATTVRRGGKEETVWYKITLWGDKFDKMLPYLKKGTALIVHGELGKPEIYTDREGKANVSLEITAETIRFSPFGRGEKSPQEGAEAHKPAQAAMKNPTANAPAFAGGGGYTAPDLDDGLPF